jgi:hypothetical protein
MTASNNFMALSYLTLMILQQYFPPLSPVVHLWIKKLKTVLTAQWCNLSLDKLSISEVIKTFLALEGPLPFSQKPDITPKLCMLANTVE